MKLFSVIEVVAKNVNPVDIVITFPITTQLIET